VCQRQFKSQDEHCGCLWDYAKHASTTAGTLGLESAAPDYQAALVLFSDMDTKLPGLILPSEAAGS